MKMCQNEMLKHSCRSALQRVELVIYLQLHSSCWDLANSQTMITFVFFNSCNTVGGFCTVKHTIVLHCYVSYYSFTNKSYIVCS